MPHVSIDMTDPQAFWPFDGDGRTKVAPTEDIKELYKNTTPVSMTRGFARTLIERFNKDGRIVLEKTGGAVWVIEVWAHSNSIETAVIKHPFGGWFVKQIGYTGEEDEEEEIADDLVITPSDADIRSRILI